MGRHCNIRNIGILAHVDAGKTTITENMLFESGSIKSLGNVDRGTSHTDFLDVERERGISVKAASASFNWNGCKINLIDTPGHADFFSEVERTISAIDSAILVVSAVEGVQAQTEALWKVLNSAKKPIIIFINKIDRIGSDVSKVISQIQKHLSKDIIPLQSVLGEGEVGPSIKSMYNEHDFIKLIEFLADRDDEVLKRYVNEDFNTISYEYIKNKLIYSTKSCNVYPIFFGSALKNIGVKELLDAIVEYLPEPKVNYEENGDVNNFSGIVYKVEYGDPLGKASHVRVFNGSVGVRDIVVNQDNMKEDKVTRIKKISNVKYIDSERLSAGDIGVVYGLNSAGVGNIVGSLGSEVFKSKIATPVLRVRVYPKDESRYLELISALNILNDEDPTLDFEWVNEDREANISIMGTIQIEVLTSIFKSRFNLDVYFGEAAVIYKEAPIKAGEGFVSYTMPKPCWAVLRFIIEPGKAGSGVIYESKAKADDILPRYQKQVEKAIPNALKQGLYGWEVTDIKITLIGGEYHVMHTHAPDFTVATPMGIMDGLSNVGTKLLEPILSFRITAPDDMAGRILSDITQMRGSYENPIIQNGNINVEGTIPAATSLDYSVRLASMSGGRGVLTTSFLGYKECALELGKEHKRIGVNPLDKAKYILYARNALASE